MKVWPTYGGSAMRRARSLLVLLVIGGGVTVNRFVHVLERADLQDWPSPGTGLPHDQPGAPCKPYGQAAMPPTGIEPVHVV